MTYRSCFHATLLIVFVKLLNALAQESRFPPSSYRFDDPLSLLRITSYEELRRAVSDIDGGSEVKRIMVITKLKEKLADESPVSLSGYTVGADQYNMAKVGGRARWLIEHVLQQEIPNSNSNLSVDERIRLWQVNASLRRLVIERPVPELKQKYAGTIRTGLIGDMAKTSIEAMDRLLEEWFPYGKRIADLAEITGAQIDMEPNEAVLRFDSGRGGWEYRFRINKGLIESVLKESLN